MVRKLWITGWIAVAGVAFAQVNATVNGTVGDATGALIPGVEVTATNVNTGIVTTVLTNEAGSYRPNFGGDANLAGRFTNQVVVDGSGNIVLQNPQPGTTGNTSQRIYAGPTNLRFDAALSKRIRIGESKSFTIRADAVNVLNHPVWGDPNTDINSNIFGRITTATGSRTVTINARVDF